MAVAASILALSAFVDATSSTTRLSELASKRLALRLATTSRDDVDEFASLRASDVSVAPHETTRLAALKRARDEFLALAAKEWLENATARSAAERRRDVVVGLARWDVEPSLASAFFQTRSDASLFARTPRIAQEAERFSTRRASDDAVIALTQLAAEEGGESAEALAVDGGALDAAIAFLQELGAENRFSASNEYDSLPFDAYDASESFETRSSAILWGASSGRGWDASGFVVASDLAAGAEAALAARLCRANSRLFLILLLAATPFTVAARWSSTWLTLLSSLTRLSSIVTHVIRRRRVRPTFSRYDFAIGYLSTVRLLN